MFKCSLVLEFCLSSATCVFLIKIDLKNIEKRLKNRKVSGRAMKTK